MVSYLSMTEKRTNGNSEHGSDRSRCKDDGNPVCPKTGAPMRRDTRAMTLTYKGESITFDMPGWYCDWSDESIHTGRDMKVSDWMLNCLKAR